MRIAIVGCGYVADYYLKTLQIHPELELLGVMDRDRDRTSRFAAFHSLSSYESLPQLLDDARVDTVVNLTNPKSHFAVSRACLEAGKHVYSEKPLAMKFSEAEDLVDLAERKGLHISSAPCSILNEAGQTVWKALREQLVGSVRLVYAEMDDGLVHRKPYKKWLSESGIPWPYRDEFEVGCTLEHAGYATTWLTAFFGPAKSVTAFSSCLIPDKLGDVPVEADTPDFSVACIQFRSNVVARLTCSIVAPHDHSMKFFGDEGVLYLNDSWNDRASVYLKKLMTVRRKMFLSPWRMKYPLVGKSNPRVRYRGSQQRDFCRGISDLAAAIEEQRPPRLSARYCLHNNELVLAIQSALETGAPYQLTSSFDPMDPMPWAT